MPTDPIVPRPLADALARAEAAGSAVLALGMPLCPSCELLEASLTALRDARPGLDVEIALLATPEEWAQRESLLWPRGIHVSRASIPVLVAFVGGRVAGTRQGGGPASVLDGWLTELLGPAAAPLPALAPVEGERLDALAELRGRHRAARAGLVAD